MDQIVKKREIKEKEDEAKEKTRPKEIETKMVGGKECAIVKEDYKGLSPIDKEVNSIFQSS